MNNSSAEIEQHSTISTFLPVH